MNSSVFYNEPCDPPNHDHQCHNGDQDEFVIPVPPIVFIDWVLQQLILNVFPRHNIFHVHVHLLFFVFFILARRFFILILLFYTGLGNLYLSFFELLHKEISELLNLQIVMETNFCILSANDG